MEAKLNLAAKQDHPSLAAVGGSYGSAKNPRGNTGEGRSPWGSNAGRGNNGRGRSHQYSDSRPSAASPAQAEDLHHQLLHSCGMLCDWYLWKQRQTTELPGITSAI
ncbi:TPA: hypothetical protein ACH3X1_001223 [Trebouxia sp. C0004]